MSIIDSPIADPHAVVTCQHARFTILTSRFLRMEWSEDGCFEDRATLAVNNRRLPVPRFTVKHSKNGCIIDTGALRLVWSGGPGFTAETLTVTLAGGGTWHFGDQDPSNLGGTRRTLDGFDGDCKEDWKPGRRKTDPWKPTGKWIPQPMPPGLISRSGWAVHDDSAAPVLQEDGWVAGRPAGQRQDLYFLGYGRDFRACLQEASLVFGRQRLPPRQILGYWYSRYWCYTDRELEDLVDDFDRRGLPLDVLVVDMDWHRLGWTGYSFDQACFPDPDRFLKRLHQRGLGITLNLHPAMGVGDHEDAFADFAAAVPDLRPEPVAKGANGYRFAQTRIPFRSTDPAYMRAYFDHLHRPLQQRGVDFWWMDWQQGKTTDIPGLDPLPWLNHLHWQDQEVDPARTGRRPLNFSRYGGLGSGRYPIGFSGDTHATWRSLAHQPGFTATAGNVLYGYWSHDIGGHMHGEPLDGELYLRWVQFGALSPVLRTHTTKRPWCERRFWTFAEPWSRLLEQAVKFRYALIPEIYAACRATWDTGLAPCRPLYLHHPDEKEAYRHSDQYWFGERLLCAPVVSPADPDTMLTKRPLWLPPGQWIDTARGMLLEGGKRVVHYSADEIPVFVAPGAIIAQQAEVKRLAEGSYPHPVLVCHPGGKGSGRLYDDDGVSEDYLGSPDSRKRGAASSLKTSSKGTLVGSAEIPLTQQQQGRIRQVGIGPVRGGFRGFLRQRPVSLVLPGVLPPSTVTVDGRKLPWDIEGAPGSWRWDGETASLHIHLAPIDLGRRTVVKVAGLDEAPAGFACLLRRLSQMMTWTKANSPVGAIHAQERLPIQLAQTGHRIALRPDTASEEIAALRAGLACLAGVIRFHVRNLPGKATPDSPEHIRVQLDWAAAWARAGRLLKVIRADLPEWFRRQSGQ